MFVGKYYNSIDSKSRLIIPAKFRDDLGPECVVAVSFDKCLTVYPVDEWQKFLDELDDLPKSKQDVRKLKRFYNSCSIKGDIDKQGRVTIPAELLKMAKIDKELVTIGSNKFIEVWSKDIWDEQFVFDDEALDDISKLAEELGF